MVLEEELELVERLLGTLVQLEEEHLSEELVHNIEDFQVDELLCPVLEELSQVVELLFLDTVQEEVGPQCLVKLDTDILNKEQEDTELTKNPKNRNLRMQSFPISLSLSLPLFSPSCLSLFYSPPIVVPSRRQLYNIQRSISVLVCNLVFFSLKRIYSRPLRISPGSSFLR